MSSLGPLLNGHTITPVQRHEWASIKSGKLLAWAAHEFDVLLTADKGMGHQQNLEITERPHSHDVSILGPRGVMAFTAKTRQPTSQSAWPARPPDAH